MAKSTEPPEMLATANSEIDRSPTEETQQSQQAMPSTADPKAGTSASGTETGTAQDPRKSKIIGLSSDAKAPRCAVLEK